MEQIYTLTKKINDYLHFDFGIKNLYHRMVFTACALVAKRYGASLVKGMDFHTFQASIHSTLKKSFQDQISQNNKLNILLEVYSEIRLNSTENQDAIDGFIDWVENISDCINSDYWNGEDVMAIFFNEFTRYKGKAEKGQVFTPDHITSLMYRLIDINKDSVVFDGACGSGAFLVKSMCNMIKEAGGISTKKADNIMKCQIYGIEFDREIYALACANMLIHKDGITHLEQLDTRSVKAGEWIQSKPITKVLMNPPFENKHGCLDIVKNVLDNVPKETMCAFILPDNKLEKHKTKSKLIIAEHRLMRIIKLPESIFSGVTTSIFIFKSGVAHNENKIFACYIEDDGFETVKNQGRHDVRNKWQEIEDKWCNIIYEQSGSDTIKWLDPKIHLSYVLPNEQFSLSEEDFRKAVFDYVLFKKSIDVREFKEKIANELLYSTICDYNQNEKEIIDRIEEYKKRSCIPIDTRKWTPFSIGELFTNNRPEKRAFNDYSEGSIPFVASGNYNNGVKGYVEPKKNEIPDSRNCITVSAVDGSAFYQDADFLGRGGGGSSINILRHKKLNEYIGIFLSVVIGKTCSKYKFDDMCSAAALKKEIIYLPSINNEPDWEYMEMYIKNMPYIDMI